MIKGILALAAFVFIGYAIVTHYGRTDPTEPVYKRVIAAIFLGCAAVGALIMSYIPH